MALPRIVWSRRWLVLLVAVVVTAGVAFAVRPGKLAYEATTRVQLTTPQEEDVNLLDQYRSTDVRDEATRARNNFIVILKSPDVQARTAADLSLDGDDARYSLDARQIRDTDYIDVVFRATTPELATSIANAHVQQAIRRYGELRAKPASATKDLLAQALKAAASTTPSDASSSTPPVDAYQMLLKKYAEAAIAAQGAEKVNYIQVIDPAATAVHIASTERFATSVGLGALGGLGLGVVLAVLLDWHRRPRFVVQGVDGRTIHFDFGFDQPVVVPESHRRPLNKATPIEIVIPDDEIIVGQPAAAPAALPAPDPEKRARERLDRALALARPVLVRAERAVAADEPLGSALRALRAVAFDQQKALEGAADAFDVAERFRTGVAGVVYMVTLAEPEAGRRLESYAFTGADLDALVDEALANAEAADLLVERASEPVAAIRAVQLLAEAAAAGAGPLGAILAPAALPPAA